MAGTPNPIEQVGGLNSVDPVVKAEFVSWAKQRTAQLMASASELRSFDLAGQEMVFVKTTGRAYALDTSDSTTADDGVSCVQDFNGLRFKALPIEGTDGTNGIDGTSMLTRVRAVATTNIPIGNSPSAGLENGDTVDGVVLATNDLVLLTAQTTPSQNGIYTVVASGAASRTTAFSTFASMPGIYVSVTEGTVNGDTLWRCITDAGGTLGTTTISFTKFSSGAFVPATYDNAGVQAAVDAAAAAGGGIVQLQDADYTFSAAVTISTDNIWIIGSPKTRVLAVASATAIGGLFTVSGALGTDTTIGANAAIGDKTITVTSAAAIAAGDYIAILIQQAATANFYMMLTRVLTKVGSDLTIADPMPFVVLTGDTSTSIRKVTLRENIRIEKMKILGNGNSGATTRGILAQFMLRSHIGDVYVDGFHNGAGIYYDYGYANSYDRLNAYDCGNVNEDDVLIRAQTAMIGGDITSESASGFGPKFQYTSWCVFGKTTSRHSNSRGTKLQGSVFCTFSALMGTRSGATGVGITLGSCDNLISNIVGHSNRGGSGGNDVGLWFSGQYNKRNQISNLIAQNNADLDIQINDTDSDNSILDATYTTIGMPTVVANNVVGRTALQTFFSIETQVDFNAANTDTQIAIPLPSGKTRYRLVGVAISKASVAINTCTCGVFSAAAAAGTALVTSATAVTVSSASDNANNNMQLLTVNNANTEAYTFTPLYFRVQTAKGSAATAVVTLIVEPLP